MGEARQPVGRSGGCSSLCDALGKVRERYQERAINTREFLQVFEEELPPSLRLRGAKIAGLVL